MGNYSFNFSKDDIEEETGHTIIPDIDEMKIISDYLCKSGMRNGEKIYYGFKYKYFRGIKKCYEISWGREYDAIQS